MTRSQTTSYDSSISYSQMVSDKASSTTTKSMTTTTTPRTRIQAKRYARKPFNKIPEANMQMDQENTSSIVTPEKNETSTTGNKKQGAHALFSVIIPKDSRTRASVSYSAAAKGTTPVLSSTTNEMISEVPELNLNNSVEEEQTEEKVVENVVVPDETTGNTDDFVPAKKSTGATTPRGAADKKRRIELRRASNGGVSRTNSSSSNTAEIVSATTVPNIKKPQTTWAIPASTGPAWKKPTSTPVTPIEVPVVETVTPKVNPPPVAPVSRSTSNVSTTSTTTPKGTTNFTSFAAAVSRQQSLTTKPVESAVPSVSVTELESTHNLSTPVSPVLSSAPVRTMTRTSTGGSGTWATIVKPTDQHNTSALDLDTSVVSGDNDGTNSVMTNDTGKLHRNNTIEPLTDKKLERRLKDINMGKAIKGYSNYIAAVPINKRDQRKREHPVTPDRYKEMSKKVWDYSVATWKSRIHLWDDNNPKEALAKLAASEGTTTDVPQVRRQSSKRLEPTHLTTSLSSSTSPTVLAYQTIVEQSKSEENNNDDV